MKIFLLALCILPILQAAEPQNPSPMVEHTRKHPRLTEAKPPGQRIPLERGQLFIPDTLANQQILPLLVFLHGGTWLPEVAAAQTQRAVLHWQTSTGYAPPFKTIGAFQSWLKLAAEKSGKVWNRVELGGWSAGCGGIREIVAHAEDLASIHRVLLLDGVHSSYTTGKPGPLESSIDTQKLAAILALAKSAMAKEKTVLLVHGEIFPGTYASTTETADWLLSALNLERKAVLKWGPMGTQQLSEASAGNFFLQGYAGNSAPDHVDLLHALPDFLKLLDGN